MAVIKSLKGRLQAPVSSFQNLISGNTHIVAAEDDAPLKECAENIEVSTPAASSRNFKPTSY